MDGGSPSAGADGAESARLDAAHFELPELAAAEGCASSDSISVWFQHVDETLERFAVLQRVTLHDEWDAKRSETGISVTTLDPLVNSEQRGEYSADPADAPSAIEFAHSRRRFPSGGN